jgi:hypothetical protein
VAVAAAENRASPGLSRGECQLGSHGDQIHYQIRDVLLGEV